MTQFEGLELGSFPHGATLIGFRSRSGRWRGGFTPFIRTPSASARRGFA